MQPDERRLERLDRLERVIRTQSLLDETDLDLGRFTQRVVDELRELTHANAAVVELVEGDELVYHAASGRAAAHLGLRLPRTASLSGLCLSSGAVQSCVDARVDPRVDPALCRRLGARSVLCTPLLRTGVPIGVLKVYYEQVQAFDDEDVEVLCLLAGALASALGRQMALEARAVTEARLRASEERLRTMLEFAHDAVVSVDEAGRVTQWNRAAERLFGWAPIEAMGTPVAELIVPPALRADFARVLASFVAAERLEDAHQRVAVPAVDRGGRALAVEVSLTATRVDGRWELTAFGHDVSERKRLEGQLREMALSDGLTGLANRRAFMESLEKAVARAVRLERPMALLFIDLDRFKAINDDFGHHVGDLALQAFASRLERCVRRGDVVARLGGDEFTVLAEGVDAIEHAQAIERKIHEAMRPPLEQHGLRLRASIGISLYRAPADASQFLREADHAMYEAKRRRAAASDETLARIEAMFD
ncbi:MAG TPA: diguanylate cyclase [Burkholderiaceae bacterium]